MYKTQNRFYWIFWEKLEIDCWRFSKKTLYHNAREFLGLSRIFVCLPTNLSSVHVPGPTESLVPFSRYLQKIRSSTYKKIYRLYIFEETRGGIAEKERSSLPSPPWDFAAILTINIFLYIL